MSNIEAKMPEAGEYWESNAGVRIRVIGQGLSEFDYVCIYNKGQSTVIDWRINGHLLRHLPGCDSFEWENPKFPPTVPLREILQKMPIGFDSCDRYREELRINPALITELEQKMVDNAESILTKLEADVAAGGSFPQYWSAFFEDTATAFVRRDSLSRCTVFKKDGAQIEREWNPVDDHCDRRLLTEAEAMALLDKPVAAEPIPAATVENTFPSNQQLFEAVANLRDQMDRMNKRFANQGYYPEACINLRVPESGDPVVDHLILAAVRRDIAVAFVSGSLAFSPIGIGRSDWQESNQLADLPKAAAAFADDMLKELGFSK